MELLFSILIIALLVDGIKLLVESYGNYTPTRPQRNPKQTTVLLSAYNEPNIVATIDSLIPEANHFLVVNDCSTDQTGDTLHAMGEQRVDQQTTPYGILSTYTYRGRELKILDNDTNRGKVQSIHGLLNFVQTKYVFVCDGDIYLSQWFEMPVNILEQEEADAVCFFVLPSQDSPTIWEKFQFYEYLKSMQIGKRFADLTRSVECISGAAGLFTTARIRRLSRLHSTRFQGEDLERTLLELHHGGKVKFSQQLIFTDVPTSLWGLARQRIMGWWGGLYRNFIRMIRLIALKKAPMRLRFEMFYNSLSMVFDPVKILAFWGLVITGSWKALLTLYLVYLLFEMLVSGRLRKEHPSMRISPKAILLYPIYGLLQLHFRLLGGLYMAGHTLTRLAGLVALLALFPLAGYGQQLTTGAEYSQYQLGDRDWQSHTSLYVGVGDVYGMVNTGLYDQLTLGAYLGAFTADVSIRETSIAPKLLYEHWMGNSFLRFQGRYNYLLKNDQPDLYQNHTSLGIGYGFYRESGQYGTIDLLRQFEYNPSWILVGRIRQPLAGRLQATLSGSLNDKGHYSITPMVGWGSLYLYHTHSNNFDFTGLPFSQFGVGVSIKW